MRTYLMFLPFLLFFAPASAQKTIPLTADAWNFYETTAEFTTYLGQAALRLQPGQPAENTNNLVSLKGVDFKNGTIEYDVAFTDATRFATVYFRYRDEENTEHVYLRNNGSGNSQLNTSIQYAAVIGGVNLWDLSAEYQSNADLKMEGYNHVKIVVRDRQLMAYVNDMDKPTLYIPCLDGEVASGKISFDGDVYLANVSVEHDAVGDLPPGSGFDPVYNDSRYLRNWRVSTPIDLPFGREPTTAQLPDSNSSWVPIAAERLGLINLSRRFGATPRGERRMTWLTTTINADKEQLRRLDLGFSDEVYVYLNGAPLYFDKNPFATPGMKTPRGRLSVENSTFDLPLRAGENELTIGVTNYFFGWGIVARLDDTGGLRLSE